MPKITSLLKSICGKIMAIPMKLTKKMYREMALLTVGGAIVSVVAFSSNGFAGSGKNAVSANVVGSFEDEQSEDDPGEELSSILVEAGLETTTVEEEFRLFPETFGIIGATISNADESVLNNAGSEYNKADDGEIEKSEDIVSDKDLISTEEEPDEEIKLAKIEQKETGNEKMVRLLEERRIALGLPSLTVEDYSNLLKIVEAEVGDNDVYGRTIVANVVINRVKSDHFADTITDVIFTPGQFSPIRDKRFFKVKVSEATIKGVNNALMGEDYSQGALYFMDRAYSARRAVGWFDSTLNYLFSHGGHEYFK